MDQRVNNALCFEVTRTMVARPEIRCIFYSLCSLDAPPSVDVFKFRMGYTSKPVCERVVFHPFVKPFVQPAMHSAVDWMRQRYPSSHFLAKADGMLRVYLDGKQPLSEQVWPECLSDRKTKLLQNLSYEQEIQEGSMGTAASVPR